MYHLFVIFFFFVINFFFFFNVLQIKKNLEVLL